mmetsp:Transcript_63699/g.74621  ORF Transcript_63699/g.74621 Transcript_63699/m.74621 type:complete len:707 (-) Transcript_63699:84-2204(-)
MSRASRFVRLAIAIIFSASFIVQQKLYNFYLSDVSEKHQREHENVAPAVATVDDASFTEFVSNPVTLLNREIGSITRLCRQYGKSCLLPTGSEKETGIGNVNDNGSKNTNNINSPMPIRGRSWITNNHDAFQGYEILLYYSSRNTQSMGVLGMESKSRWKRLDVNLNFGVHPCQSLHSPSIFVNDEERKLYMYVHGYGCRFSKKISQPTLLFESDDGVNWNFQPKHSAHLTDTDPSPYLFNELFYLSVPVILEEYGQRFYYAIAKTQENSVERTVLVRSASLIGPFEIGPVLGRGLRHVDLYVPPLSTSSNQTHQTPNGMIYVFFTLVGDSPERILLGTIDTSWTTKWKLWKLMPGPRILQPEYAFEHGNAVVAPSAPGVEKGKTHQLRDPRFLPNEINHDIHGVLAGKLFYSVQGEQGLAMARLSVDLSRYHQGSIAYRHFENVAPDIYNSSSLRVDVKRSRIRKQEKTLITGIGRSGTMFMCTFFQKIDIQVSHDNDKDCGPYPGPDGAVSWYDAFYTGRRYDRVLHLVRDPLKTIASRMKRKHTRKWLVKHLSPYEKVTSINDMIFAIKHWVRRNSFVERHASWRVQAEMFYSEPLAVWELCMAAGFTNRCPDLTIIRAAMDQMPSNINTWYNASEASRRPLTWDFLELKVGPENEKYVAIAKTMARNYGYSQYANVTLVEYDCEYKVHSGNRFEDWDCSLKQ